MDVTWNCACINIKAVKLGHVSNNRLPLVNCTSFDDYLTCTIPKMSIEQLPKYNTCSLTHAKLGSAFSTNGVHNLIFVSSLSDFGQFI